MLLTLGRLTTSVSGPVHVCPCVFLLLSVTDRWEPKRSDQEARAREKGEESRGREKKDREKDGEGNAECREQGASAVRGSLGGGGIVAPRPERVINIRFRF